MVEIAIEMGKNQNIELLLVEPNIHALPAKITEGTLTDQAIALEQADVKVILVKHREFKSLGANVISFVG